MNKTLLRSYARLIAEVGGNVQKGQEVFITAQLDQPEFVKMLVGTGGRGMELPAASEGGLPLPHNGGSERST